MSKFFPENSLLKLFDNFGSYTAITTGSNILNLGGFSGSTLNGTANSSIEAVTYNCQLYAELLNAITRLSEYRQCDLAKTVLEFYTDSVFSNIDLTSKELISIEGMQKETEEINKVLVDLSYPEMMKEHSKDMIYYGSSAIKVDKVGDKKFSTRDFKYPFTTGYIKAQKEYVIQTDNGPRFMTNMLRFAFDDYLLYLDDKSAIDLGIRQKEEMAKKNTDPIYTVDRITCSEPLFLAGELKIKDYVLKDLISSFLSLIILIEQDTFTVDAQRMSDMDSIIELCERVKNLLVTKDDMNLLASARLDKNALIRRLFDRYRVIPSIASTLNNMQAFNPGDLKAKFDSINQQKEQVRDEVLTMIGFPLDLYKGSTNKWEVGRQAERYNIKQINIKNALYKSTVKNTLTVGNLLGYTIDPRKVKCPFIKETQAEVANKTQMIQGQNETLTAVQNIISTVGSIVESENLKDKDKVLKSMNKLMKSIGLEDIEFTAKQSDSNNGINEKPSYM